MKLSTQLDPIHWGQHHADLLSGWQPKSIRIINPDRERIRRILDVCPNSLIVLRNHAISEDHNGMLTRPEQLGIEHAAVCVRDMALWGYTITDQFVFLGINEPRVWETGVREALVIYSLSFMRELDQHGMRGLVGNYSTGWEGNLGTGLPPNWEPFEPVLRALENQNRHMLGLHEYWCKDGPKVTADLQPDMAGGPWGWNPGRYVQLPWNVPILIGECGLEQLVCDSTVDYWQRGWRAYYGAEPWVYTSQLLDYEAAIRQDPRIHSAQIYILDGNTHHWGSLYYEPQIPSLGKNTDFNWFVELGPAPPDELEQAVYLAGRSSQTLSLNPYAALQRVIYVDELWPVGNETEVTVNGLRYVVQRGEDPATGDGVTYYVEVGHWDDVRTIRDEDVN